MAEIKISDLSIGDWVEIDGEPAKALCLRIAGGHIFKGVSGQMYRCCGGMDFKPIPLTPEILEKNGFERGEYSEIREYNEWEIGEWSNPPYVSVKLDIDRQVIRVTNRGRDMFIADKEVYVHQLQHALRLAGVGKEIEL